MNNQFTLREGFTYTAHTGCAGTKDNSLESIDAAVEHNADIIEIDLHFTRDGKPVLSHDKPTGGEISLDEAFRKIAAIENLRVNVDVKKTSHLETVKPIAEKYGMLDRIFYTGLDKKMVEDAKIKSPGVPYYLNTKVRKIQTPKYLATLVEKVRDSGAIGINFNKDNATKKLVDFFHENGLLVSIWTVNKEEDMLRILSYSPDNITTRQPDIMKTILKNK